MELEPWRRERIGKAASLLWTGWSNTHFISTVKAGKLEDTGVWFSSTAVAYCATFPERRFTTKATLVLLLVYVRGSRSKTNEH